MPLIIFSLYFISLDYILFSVYFKFFPCHQHLSLIQKYVYVILAKLKKKTLENFYWFFVCIFFWLVGLVSLFNGISSLFRLFNAKAILLEEQ